MGTYVDTSETEEEEVEQTKRSGLSQVTDKVQTVLLLHNHSHEHKNNHDEIP